MPRKPQTESTPAPSKRAASAQKTQADAQPKQSKDVSAPRQRAASAQKTPAEPAPRKLTPKQKNELLKQKLQQLLDEM